MAKQYNIASVTRKQAFRINKLWQQKLKAIPATRLSNQQWFNLYYGQPLPLRWEENDEKQVEEAFGVGQSWQYSVDFLVYRYRIALKIQARRKAIISAYALRYPEFYERVKLLRFRGCAVSEQFNELRRWRGLA